MSVVRAVISHGSKKTREKCQRYAHLTALKFNCTFSPFLYVCPPTFLKIQEANL